MHAKHALESGHLSSDVNAPARIWQSGTCNPPVPAWISDAWVRQGCPGVKGSEGLEPEARALLWFAGNWYAPRLSYRFVLPAALVEWLNATDVDFTARLRRRPALKGSVPCAAFKPVSRFMRSVWEQRGHTATFETVEGYYDFLAEYAFGILPESNAPAALLPRAIVDLLNAPADEGDVPLTVGMLLYIKRKYPNEYQQLGGFGLPRIMALSFHALEGLLAIGDPRLIPGAVSGFWNQRPLQGGSVTAFEYVARAANNPMTNGAHADQAVEKEIRNWFHGLPVLKNPGVLLFSGPPAELPPAPGPVEQIEDRAILVYRDQVTIAGLSRAGACLNSALPQTGLQVFDLHFSLRREGLSEEAERNRRLWINARRKLHILNLNPEYLPECYYCNLNRIGSSDYMVGQFFWELSKVSKAHEPGIAIVDEIWTASSYLTRLYKDATNKPVVTMGMVVSGMEAPPLQPEQFGFGKQTYLFLSSFDASSVVERKNPLGTVIAFQKAFPRGTEGVGLIIKTRNLEHASTPREKAHWTSALERINRDPRIRLIQHTMGEHELAGLYRMCDCFVSLHRSEGFGFGPAEAMAHGKPVIVTNYSGVCDFCTDETAKLVNYDLIRVRPDEYPFLDPDRVYEWADPDLNMAAEHMRRVAEDRAHSEQVGSAARTFILREYGMDAVRDRYLARLEQLGFGPDSTGRCSRC
jgi:glycosyltransferase involved in cell wall biosynthesis